ncbi:MAG: hypothetical protein JSV59_12390 [Flavobacteriaceae bacterium]|nr:MAG: hypothetical protein JSV59_12390 [Flavobacteriaceae bacterium]
MSKRALKKYLTGLKKPELEEQMVDLYDRFPSVKQYYDFVFNPREDKWVQEAKVKISNEYFPLKRKKARARRSVAQKYIKQFLKLGMAPHLIADVMLYNLEVAQSFSKERNVPDAFYKSMLNSFIQLIQHVSLYEMLPDFKDRIIEVYNTTLEQNWEYSEGFARALDIID